MFRLPLSRYITMLTGTRINTTLLPKALRYPSNVKSASTTTNTEISEKAKPYSSIPGPTRWQLLRMYLPGGDLYNKPVKMKKNMRELYGNLAKIPGILGKRDLLISFDPNIYEMVQRTEGAWPIRRMFETFDYYRKHVRPEAFGGISGLLADQGESWGNMRQAVGPVLLKPKVLKSYVPVMDEVSREFVSKIRSMRDTNGEMPANFLNELLLWVTESIWATALDRRMGAMHPNHSDEAALLIKFERSPTLWRYYKTKNFMTLMEGYDTLTNVVTKYVNEAETALNSISERDGLNEESILQKLLRIDRRYATLIVFDMIFAGIDTTTATTANFLHRLAVNPEKQDKLIEEVFQLLPEIDSPLTEESLKNAPYFRACLKESMRVQTTVPGLLRTTAQDIVMNGYQVPKNSDINMTMMTTDESYFKDAKKFIPERWLRDSDKAVQQGPSSNPFNFIPFGYGKRSRVGRRLAEMKMHILTLRILRAYRIEWHHGPIKYAQSSVRAPTSPLRLRMVPHV